MNNLRASLYRLAMRKSEAMHNVVSCFCFYFQIATRRQAKSFRWCNGMLTIGHSHLMPSILKKGYFDFVVEGKFRVGEFNVASGYPPGIHRKEVNRKCVCWLHSVEIILNDQWHQLSTHDVVRLPYRRREQRKTVQTFVWSRFHLISLVVYLPLLKQCGRESVLVCVCVCV